MQASKFVKIHGSKLLLLSLRAGSKSIFVVANLFCHCTVIYGCKEIDLTYTFVTLVVIHSTVKTKKGEDEEEGERFYFTESG